MAKKGYFPPQGRRRVAKTRQNAMRKKADPYTLDQNRDNPDVTDYDRSSEALEHEMPDTRTEWEKDERTPVGLPAPSPQMVGSKKSRPQLNAKEARKIEAHASRALRIAKAMVPDAAFKRLSVAGREDLLLRQANDLMGLSDASMQRVLARVDKLQSFAASFSRQALDPEMGPEAPMGAPEGDLMEEPEAPMDVPDEEMDFPEEMGEGEESGLDPEVKEYIDETVEEAVDEAVDEAISEGELGEGEEELELAPAEDGLSELSSSEVDMPSDDELLGLLDDKAASQRYARDPNHWEESVMNVEQPSEDYHSQSADYYGDGSNSEKFEEQMDLSNPVMDKGANRRRRRRPQRKADGETQNPDQGGLNPFDGDEDYHDADSHSYEEKPMGTKFEEQMDLSNPVLDKGGQHPPKQSAYAGNEDSLLQQMFVESMQRARLPIDASGNIDASIMGTSGREDGPTVLAEFVQGRREIDPSNVQRSAGTQSRVASRQRRRAPARRAQGSGRPVRRQASSPKRQAPRKAGARSVGNLGRKASLNPQREIQALSSMWPTDPDVSKVFG